MDSFKSTKALTFPHEEPDSQLLRKTSDGVKSNSLILGDNLPIKSTTANDSAIGISWPRTVYNKEEESKSN